MADRSVVVRLIADTSSYNSRMRGAAQSTREVGTAGQFSEDRLSDLKKVVATFAVGSVVKAGVEFDALKQRSQAAFTTITGSSAAANRELSDLYSNFKNNPFGYPQILKTSQQLLAMGTGTKDLVREVTDLSDATAAVGGNAELLDRVALAFGQMKAKGTIQAEEMRQLAENGIPAWQMLAHEIGVSVPQAMKLVEQRKVDSERGIEALMQGIEKKFGGATANLRNTWTGTLTAFKTEAVQAGGEIVKPLMRIGTDGMHAVEPLLRTAGQLGTQFSNMPTPMQNTALAVGAVMLMSNRLNSVWTNSVAVGGRFAEQMRVQQSLAAMNGVQMTRMSAAMTVARMRAMSLGAGLMGAFGGPAGLAIIGATIGLSIYQQRQQEAAQAVAQHRAEVQGLTSEIDRNTLALNQNSTDTKLAGLTYGSDPHGDPYKVLNYLNQIPGAAQVARDAINGDTTALAHLKTLLINANAGKFEYGAKAAFNSVAAAAGSAREAARQVADEMRLRLPDAAHETGLSVQSITGVFNNWVAKGGDLKKMLRDSGVEAATAAQIYDILAGSANNVAGSFSNAGAAASQMRADIASAAGQFATITGAWDTAMGAAQSAASGANSGRAPRVSDDPAYRKAKKAYDEQYRQLRDLKQADKDRLQPLKDTAAAERDAANAASKRATALKKTADAAKKASNEAADAVKKAQDQKAQADRNAHDAAALAAAIKQEALHAGTADAGAYAAAQAKANLAATSTAATKAAATAALAKSQQDAVAKKVASDAATAAYNAEKKHADALKRQADTSAAIAKSAARQIELVERVAERKHEQLLNAKNRAEQKAQKKSEAYSSGVSGAYSSMSKNVDISLNQYLDTLQNQVTAQRNWKNNLIELASKVPPAMVQQLAKLGPQAAPLVQKLVDGTDQQLGRFVSLFAHTGDDASKAMAGQIQVGSALISQVAAIAGTDAATKLANAIRSGKTTVGQALGVLGGEFDKKTMKIKMGMKNPKDIADALDRLLNHTVYLIKPIKTLVHGQQGFKVTGTTTTFGYKDGGWIRGGSGARDDVPVLTPNWRRGIQMRAMGGEFMVRKDIAQRNKAFFDEMDRTGRMPRQAPQIVYVTAPAAGGPAKQVQNTFAPGSIVMPPGTTPRQMFQEVDRLADIGNGP